MENLSKELSLVYKLKSSNIDSYLVSPNLSLIEHGNKITIKVDLKTSKVLSREKKEIKDQFLIEYFLIE
jgi:hypothetical protein